MQIIYKNIYYKYRFIYKLRNTICTIIWLLFYFSGKAQNADSVFVKNYTIEGLVHTKKNIVLQELHLQEAKWYEKNKLKSTIQIDEDQLQQLQLFKKLEIKTIPINADTVSVAYIFKESARLTFLPNLAFNDRNFNTWFNTYNADLSRLNYGGVMNLKNIGGQNRLLHVEMQNGFNLLLNAIYEVPRSTFNKNWGWGSRFTIIHSKSFSYNIKDNKQVFYKNDTARFGKEIAAHLFAIYKPNIFTAHRFFVGAGQRKIDAAISQLNPEYLGQAQTKVNYLEIKYRFTQAKNNSPVYPTIGYKLETQLMYQGLPWGKNINKNMLTSAEVFYAKLFPIKNKFYGALHTRSRIAFTNNTFLNTRALGYVGNTVRSFEYYIVHGSHYAITRADLRYKALNKTFSYHSKKINQTLPLAIYPKIFVDAGYVVANNTVNNNMANTVLRSAGFGLDFHINNNNLMRIEYGINHLAQKGVFLNFISL